MRRAVLMGPILLLLVTAADASAQSSWCRVVDKAQVGALLGGTAPAPMQTGPEKNADAGGISTTCIFVQGQRGVVMMRVEFASAQEAQKTVSLEYLKNQEQGEDAKYVEEKGAGDRVFWGVSEEGAFYVILKGATLYFVGLGGVDSKVAAARKPALVKLTQSLVGS